MIYITLITRREVAQFSRAQGLKYIALEGAPFIPSNYQCSLLRVFEAKATEQREVETEVETLRIGTMDL